MAHLILVACAGIVGCGEDAPRTRVHSYEYDAGDQIVLAGSGAKVTHAFAFVNPSRSVIRLEKPFRNCACANVHSEPDRLGPGDTATVTVDIDLAGRRGPVTATAGYHLDELDIVVRFTLRCTAIRRIYSIPERVLLTGAEPDSAVEAMIDVVHDERLEVRLMTLPDGLVARERKSIVGEDGKPVERFKVGGVLATAGDRAQAGPRIRFEGIDRAAATVEVLEVPVVRIRPTCVTAEPAVLALQGGDEGVLVLQLSTGCGDQEHATRRVDLLANPELDFLDMSPPEYSNGGATATIRVRAKPVNALRIGSLRIGAWAETVCVPVSVRPSRGR